jgi:hypothetical protein
VEDPRPEEPQRPDSGAEDAPVPADRERTTMDAEPPTTDDPLVRLEEEAAAAEAATIGGPPHPAESDESERPLEEAGEGVAEGYEESERELVEQATHGEDRWVPDPFTAEGDEDRMPDRDEADAQARVPESSADRVQPSYGDPDAIVPTELRTDTREDRDEEDTALRGAGVAAAGAGAKGAGGESAGASSGRPESNRAQTRRRVATGLSIARAAIGAAYVAAPRLARPTWIGRAGRLGGTNVVTAGLGARDLALGAGTLLALREDPGVARPWLQAQFASDLADLAATLLHGRDVETRPRIRGLVTIAAATALAGFAAFTPDE